MAERHGDAETVLERPAVLVAHGDVVAQMLEVEHLEGEPLFVAEAQTDALREGDAETRDVCDSAAERVSDGDDVAELLMAALND